MVAALERPASAAAGGSAPARTWHWPGEPSHQGPPGRTAQDGAAAQIRRDRASIQLAHYDSLIRHGWSTNEEAALGFQAAAAVRWASAAVSYAVQARTPDGWMSFGSGPVASALSSAASAAPRAGGSRPPTPASSAATRSRASRRSSPRRRARRPEPDAPRPGPGRDHAARAAVTGPQVDHAEKVLDFLVLRHFGTAEHYEWSAASWPVSTLLLPAGHRLAQLAEAQLAFERQSTLPPPSQTTAGRSRRFGRRQGAPTRTAGAAAELDYGDDHSARQCGTWSRARRVRVPDRPARAASAPRRYLFTRLEPVAFKDYRRTGVQP